MAEFLEYTKRFQAEPWFFIERILGATPTKQQMQVLQAIAQPGAKVSVKSGHGTGKSTLDAWVVLWFVTNFPDAIVPCTAPTGHQLEDILWKEIAIWHQKMDPWYKDQVIITKDRVQIKGLEKTQFAVARTARKENPDALQGFHAPNLLFIIDEASGVPESIFEVARGALSTRSARVLMTGNPTQLTGYFYGSHHKMRESFTCITLSGLDSPLVDEQYILDMERDYGRDSDMFRVRVLGEFPNASIMQLIPLSLVEGALGKHLREDQYNFAPIILGCDPAWYGDDTSTIYMRQGLMSKELFAGRNVDNITLGGMLAKFEDDLKADSVFIDQGWGAGVIDFGRSLGRDWIPVAFGGSANDPRYINKRTEMWCKGKEWLESGGSLPPIDKLRDDLIGPQYCFNPSGKIQLERKEDMKKRGLASPDRADGLFLTFAQDVVPKHIRGPQGATIVLPPQRLALMDFDPFSSDTYSPI